MIHTLETPLRYPQGSFIQPRGGHKIRGGGGGGNEVYGIMMLARER